MVDNHNPNVARWVDSEGNEVNWLTGRTRISWRDKINPLWWFGNDADPVAPNWFKPASSELWRSIAWQLRNPMSNFSAFVIGVKDRDYIIRGTAPLDAGTLADVGKTGWKWSVIELGPGLPFVGYAGKRVLFYIGWAWEGNLGAKFNIRNSSIQGV